jgi:hypothetical protein
MSQKSALIAAYCALVLAFGSVLGSINLPAHFMLATNGERVTGTVVKSDCEKYGLITYTFTAAEHDFTGSFETGSDCTNIKLGESIEITFSKNDPTQNVIGNPWNPFIEELIPVVVASLLVPAVLLGAIVAGARVKSASDNRKGK